MSETEQVAQAEQVVPEEELRAEQRQLSERALDHLAEIWLEMSATDAFQQMMMELDGQARSRKQQRLDRLMAGDPVNQRDIDYERGLIDGLRRPLLIIETARRRVERPEQVEQTAEPERTYW